MGIDPPPGYHEVTARMVVDDAAAAVEFLRDVFGAEGDFHPDRPAEMRIGDSLVMVTSVGERERFPALLYVYVDDADRVYQRAVAAGATTMEPPLDTPYGDRRAMVRDPHGNVFQIAHRISAGTEAAGSFDVLLDDDRTQLDAFVEEYRSAIESALAGLTEEQARRRLVASATTLLGLLKHVTWMQRVWFEECVGGTSRRELGLVRSPDESFRLADDDTIASVTAAHRQACATARAAVADLPLDAVVTGHRSGPRTLHWVYLQVLRELAHHCGHADILREQILF